MKIQAQPRFNSMWLENITVVKVHRFIKTNAYRFTQGISDTHPFCIMYLVLLLHVTKWCHLKPTHCQLIWREKQLWLSWGFRDFRRIFWIVSILLQQWLYLYIWWCISNVIKFWYTHFHFSVKKISFLSISLSPSVLLSSSLFFFFVEFSL